MVCPKCKAPIKRFDLAPNCKVCGVHIMYYTQEEDLARDAKRTELEFANARAVFAKLKGNFIAGKVPVCRIVFCILAVASLCVPFSGVKIAMPMTDISVSTGIIGVYQMISSSVFTLLPKLFSLKIGGSLTYAVAAHIAFFVLGALLTLVCLVLWLLSFISIKKLAKATAAVAFSGVAADIGAFVCTVISASAAKGLDGITVSVGGGALVSAAMLTVFAVLNMMMAENGAPLPISDVDKKRIELYRQYKAKKLDLDSLSLPVFETEEEREKRENAISGAKKEKKGEKINV